MNRQYLILGGTFVGSAALSAGITYLVLNKRLEAKYEAIAREDLKDAKAYYKILYKQGDEYASPIDLADALDVKVQELQYVTSDESISAPRFANDDEYEATLTFNLTEEKKKRTPDAPYIVSQEEHFENPHEFTQITLTYFEEDDVLVDEGETPIEKTNETVGDVNLTRFGHGTTDKDVVYVRNERLEVDFEIVRNKGNYAKDVLGFIEHSEHLGRPRKFRRDNE